MEEKIKELENIISNALDIVKHEFNLGCYVSPEAKEKLIKLLEVNGGEQDE